MFTETIQPKACPKCGYILDPRQTECPKCVRLRQPLPAAKVSFSSGTLLACWLLLALDAVVMLWVLKNGIMLSSELPTARRFNGTAFDSVFHSYLTVNVLLGLPALVRIISLIGFLLRKRSGGIAIFIGYGLELFGMIWATLHLVPLLMSMQRWCGFNIDNDFFADTGNGLIATLWIGWTVLRLLPAFILRSVVMKNWELLDTAESSKRRKK